MIRFGAFDNRGIPFINSFFCYNYFYLQYNTSKVIHKNEENFYIIYASTSYHFYDVF